MGHGRRFGGGRPSGGQGRAAEEGLRRSCTSTRGSSRRCASPPASATPGSSSAWPPSGPFGGTAYEPAIERALEIAAESDYDGADLVLVTDERCRLGERFLRRFLGEKERRRMRLYSVLIGARSSGELERYSDAVWTLARPRRRLPRRGGRQVIRFALTHHSTGARRSRKTSLERESARRRFPMEATASHASHWRGGRRHRGRGDRGRPGGGLPARLPVLVLRLGGGGPARGPDRGDGGCRPR